MWCLGASLLKRKSVDEMSVFSQAPFPSSNLKALESNSYPMLCEIQLPLPPDPHFGMRKVELYMIDLGERHKMYNVRAGHLCAFHLSLLETLAGKNADHEREGDAWHRCPSRFFGCFFRVPEGLGPRFVYLVSMSSMWVLHPCIARQPVTGGLCKAEGHTCFREPSRLDVRVRIGHTLFVHFVDKGTGI